MTAIRVLVAGQSGQLAQALMASTPNPDFEIRAFGRPDFDLTRPDAMAQTITAFAPDIILNSAAYTDVDEAESAPDEAIAINHHGAAALASIARDSAIPIIHISTDCVFDGTSAAAYTEADTPNPLSIYGHSKLAGERAVAKANPHHLIVRVSWVFSQYGHTFVKTMLDLAARRDEITVVCDQIGFPTHAQDLAAGLLAMAKRCVTDPSFADWGLYHLAGQGETDRASMARAIFADSLASGGPTAHIRPVATADYKTPAARPLNARLDATHAKDVFDLSLPHWRSRLADCVSTLIMERQDV